MPGGIAFLNARQSAVKAPVNPMDKCTIVNIYPNVIKELKPTLEPGYWEIPAGSYDNPGILVIGPSSWWLQPDPDKPPIEIPVSAVLIANSIVTDWYCGLHKYSAG